MVHPRHHKPILRSFIVLGAICILLYMAIPTIRTELMQTFAPTTLFASANSGTEHTMVGQPSLSASFIDELLKKYGSPVVGTGSVLYTLSKTYNIDDAYALAFFWHESNFGTQGVARSTHSLSNMRCGTGYCAYRSWADSYQPWFHLIGMLYMARWGKYTVEQVIPTYAPSSDHNNVQAYIANVNANVALWRSGTVGVA